MEKTFVLCSVAFIGATLSTPLLAADSENYWMNTDRGSLAVGAFFTDETFLSPLNRLPGQRGLA